MRSINNTCRDLGIDIIISINGYEICNTSTSHTDKFKASNDNFNRNRNFIFLGHWNVMNVPENNISKADESKMPASKNSS